jgi:hypothetical protein
VEPTQLGPVSKLEDGDAIQSPKRRALSEITMDDGQSCGYINTSSLQTYRAQTMEYHCFFHMAVEFYQTTRRHIEKCRTLPCLEGTASNLSLNSIQTMEYLCFFHMAVEFYQTTRRHIEKCRALLCLEGTTSNLSLN